MLKTIISFVFLVPIYIFSFATAIRFIIWIWSQPLTGWWTLP